MTPKVKVNETHLLRAHRFGLQRFSSARPLSCAEKSGRSDWTAMSPSHPYLQGNMAKMVSGSTDKKTDHKKGKTEDDGEERQLKTLDFLSLSLT